MNDKVIIYAGITIAFIVFFIGGYYTALLFTDSRDVEEVELRMPGPDELRDIDLENGILVPTRDPYLLHGYIKEVDKNKSPVEIKLHVNLDDSFRNAPYSIIERIILLNEGVSIFVAPALLEEGEEMRVLADIDALEEGRGIIVNTEEEVTGILEKETFVAEEIKVTISEDEYQDYLR